MLSVPQAEFIPLLKSHGGGGFQSSVKASLAEIYHACLVFSVYMCKSFSRFESPGQEEVSIIPRVLQDICRIFPGYSRIFPEYSEIVRDTTGISGILPGYQVIPADHLSAQA